MKSRSGFIGWYALRPDLDDVNSPRLGRQTAVGAYQAAAGVPRRRTIRRLGFAVPQSDYLCRADAPALPADAGAFFQLGHAMFQAHRYSLAGACMASPGPSGMTMKIGGATQPPQAAHEPSAAKGGCGGGNESPG
jgi:hypothetical protein